MVRSGFTFRIKLPFKTTLSLEGDNHQVEFNHLIRSATKV